ncbi:hypothetical protein DPMN_023146 [Dreissena polymorpha]|uniref:Uncharacterized protein n=2 Tax=Dreissena polymorpha TaxID=45954 RepID=A0A9D4LMB6_DREPO|nr:hypothetical protein DPMN_023146 [Dreissena polymorpha]
MDSFAFCLNITLTQHNITFLYDNTCYKIPPNPTHIEGYNKNGGALEFDAENVDATEEENYGEYDVETEGDDVNEFDDATSVADAISDDKKMDDETLRFGTR